ncbi:tricarboxylic transporter [Hahella sp. CCB-MM4]|uniref:tripartite tricarboxylate transporter TctB family protein n=1 Tax=Hahella sp. (strain CCB-MM4) TaxID=1926491 RepID=UPI000B9A6226|nr:tripartite tricarboxylate transporter TctB family protein [Hahella sp. CCB-MM4]OZG74588.1 tricarboxylic transporter [Hahella sp. CCB-MM4]
MYDRIFAGVLLVLSGLVAWAATQLQVPFQYEPLGPKAFPLILSALMAVSAIWLAVKPGSDSWQMDKAVLIRITQALAILLAYAWMYDRLGFITATIIVGGVFSWMFGEKPLRAGAYSLVLSVCSYFLLTTLLQLNVPAGHIFGG